MDRKDIKLQLAVEEIILELVSLGNDKSGDNDMTTSDFQGVVAAKTMDIIRLCKEVQSC